MAETAADRLLELLAALAGSGERCPANQTLADRLGFSVTCIVRSLRKLHNSGRIEIQLRYGNRRRVRVGSTWTGEPIRPKALPKVTSRTPVTADARAAIEQAVAAGQIRRVDLRGADILEEAIRHIRSRDNVVVRAADGYRVNGRGPFTAAEIVERATLSRQRLSRASMRKDKGQCCTAAP